MTTYLTIVEVLSIHADWIDRYGGAHAVGDLGLLESVAFRPQTGYYRDLLEEAAVLWQSLSQNHAFVDGHKRIAFAAMYTFLAVNGVRVTASAAASWEFLSRLYETGNFRLDALVAWLRKNTEVLGDQRR